MSELFKHRADAPARSGNGRFETEAADDLLENGVVLRVSRSLRAVMWHAMGVVSKTDENGNFIAEVCGQPNMKMARHFLEWQRPEKWGIAGAILYLVAFGYAIFYNYNYNV